MSRVKMEKRTYKSPLREEQARQTRDRILDAALSLFSSQGYGATSIVSIAREAGVVPETIYASLGSKRGIVDALIERAAPPQIVGALGAEWTARAGDPAAQLEVIAHFSTTFWTQNDPLATVFRQGTGDAEIGEEWSKRQALRRGLLVSFLGAWPSDAFRAGLSATEAGDILWALSGDELFHLLVRECGWSVDDFEAWLRGALRRELLPS
jgi:AcrR family transcriptional regulator